VWVKFDDRTNDDPRLLALSLNARWLWFSGLLYIGRHSTDGHIPAAALARIGVRRARQAAQCLVDVGLWTQHASEDFYCIEWRSHCLSRVQVEAQRERTRARVQQWREQAATVTKLSPRRGRRSPTEVDE
jgi:hypothetical protein